jgi:cellulose synthase/poly-beta-1,6-N-acetylglucosamine synthase-like glycosyltransferase
LLQAEYLAVGEAPEELRNVLRQRSRWTKGHMQVRGVRMVWR